jgi:DNA-binding transcriptional LysR family regulator
MHAGEMKLNQLRALVAIADRGSVRGAAKALDISPAAVGRNLYQLEEAVQAQLIQRTPEGTILNDAGKTLLVHARLILRQMTLALDEVGGSGKRPRRISFSVSPWIAAMFLPETIALFSQTEPDVQLEIYEGHHAIALPRLRDGSLHFHIGRQPTINTEEFSFRPLCISAIAIVAREGHPLANSRSLADLNDCQWFFPWGSDFETARRASLFIRQGFPPPKHVHSVNSMSMAFQLLQRSDMLTIFPWPLIEACSKRERLCVIFVREQFDDTTEGIVTRVGHAHSAAAAFFIECLIKTMRESVESSPSQTRQELRLLELVV